MLFTHMVGKAYDCMIFRTTWFRQPRMGKRPMLCTHPSESLAAHIERSLLSIVLSKRLQARHVGIRNL